jgi:hypothetical protein
LALNPRHGAPAAVHPLSVHLQSYFLTEEHFGWAI